MAASRDEAAAAEEIVQDAELDEEVQDNTIKGRVNRLEQTVDQLKERLNRYEQYAMGDREKPKEATSRDVEFIIKDYIKGLVSLGQLFERFDQVVRNIEAQERSITFFQVRIMVAKLIKTLDPAGTTDGEAYKQGALRAVDNLTKQSKKGGEQGKRGVTKAEHIFSTFAFAVTKARPMLFQPGVTFEALLRALSPHGKEAAISIMDLVGRFEKVERIMDGVVSEAGPFKQRIFDLFQSSKVTWKSENHYFNINVPSPVTQALQPVLKLENDANPYEVFVALNDACDNPAAMVYLNNGAIAKVSAYDFVTPPCSPQHSPQRPTARPSAPSPLSDTIDTRADKIQVLSDRLTTADPKLVARLSYHRALLVNEAAENQKPPKKPKQRKDEKDKQFTKRCEKFEKAKEECARKRLATFITGFDRFRNRRWGGLDVPQHEQLEREQQDVEDYQRSIGMTLPKDGAAKREARRQWLAAEAAVSTTATSARVSAAAARKQRQRAAAVDNAPLRDRARAAAKKVTSESFGKRANGKRLLSLRDAYKRTMQANAALGLAAEGVPDAPPQLAVPPMNDDISVAEQDALLAAAESRNEAYAEFSAKVAEYERSLRDKSLLAMKERAKLACAAEQRHERAHRRRDAVACKQEAAQWNSRAEEAERRLSEDDDATPAATVDAALAQAPAFVPARAPVPADGPDTPRHSYIDAQLDRRHLSLARERRGESPLPDTSLVALEPVFRDTGAGRGYVSKAFLERYGLPLMPLPADVGGGAFGVGGGRIRHLGFTALPLNFGGVTVTFYPIVTDAAHLPDVCLNVDGAADCDAFDVQTEKIDGKRMLRVVRTEAAGASELVGEWLPVLLAGDLAADAAESHAAAACAACEASTPSSQASPVTLVRGDIVFSINDDAPVIDGASLDEVVCFMSGGRHAVISGQNLVGGGPNRRHVPALGEALASAADRGALRHETFTNDDGSVLETFRPVPVVRPDRTTAAAGEPAGPHADLLGFGDDPNPETTGADALAKSLEQLDSSGHFFAGSGLAKRLFAALTGAGLAGAFKDASEHKIPRLARGVVHRIVLSETADLGKLQQGVRPYAARELEMLDELRKTLLAAHRIRPSRSMCRAMPVIAAKKNVAGETTGYRIAFDFRALNDQSLSDGYPPPDAYAQAVAASRFPLRTTFDAVAQFYSIPVDARSVPLTASYFGPGQPLYEWLISPYGLKALPATVQRFVDSVFIGDDEFCYVDDITRGHRVDHELDTSAPFMSQPKRVRDAVLDRVVADVLETVGRADRAGIVFNIRKVQWAAPESTLLGYLVGDGYVKPHPDKLAGLVNMPEPANERQLRSFLSMANFHNGFVPNLSALTAPLRALLAGGPTSKSGVRLSSGAFRPRWTAFHSAAFQRVKAALGKAVRIEGIDPALPLYLETDFASNDGIGFVLYQEDADGRRSIVACNSRALTPAEHNYGPPKGELTAFLFALSKVGRLLRPHRFYWRTDNKPLSAVYRGGGTRESVLLERIAVALGFDLTPEHIRGTECEADCPSRLPAGEARHEEYGPADIMSVIGETPALAAVVNDRGVTRVFDEFFAAVAEEKVCVAPHLWARRLADDSLATELRALASSGAAPAPTSELAKLGVRGAVVDNSGYVRVTLADGTQPLYVPVSLRGAVLFDLHVGHRAADTMRKRAHGRFWWPTLASAVSAFGCAGCDRHKRAPSDGPHGPTVVAPRFARWQADHAGPFSLDGKDDDDASDTSKWYILTFIDTTTGFTVAEPVRTKDMATAWAVFETHVMRTFRDQVDAVVCDQAFRSGAFGAGCKQHGIDVLPTPAHDAHARGIVERLHGTLNKALQVHRAALAAQGKRPSAAWFKALVADFAWSLLVAPSASRGGYSPFELLFGDSPRTTIEHFIGSSARDWRTPAESHTQLFDRLFDAVRTATDEAAAQRERRSKADVARGGGKPGARQRLVPGQRVWVWSKTNPAKLDRDLNWTGPWVVAHVDRTGLRAEVHPEFYESIVRSVAVRLTKPFTVKPPVSDVTAETLSSLGLSPDSLVVVNGADDWFSTLPPSVTSAATAADVKKAEAAQLRRAELDNAERRAELAAKQLDIERELALVRGANASFAGAAAAQKKATQAAAAAARADERVRSLAAKLSKRKPGTKGYAMLQDVLARATAKAATVAAANESAAAAARAALAEIGADAAVAEAPTPTPTLTPSPAARRPLVPPSPKRAKAVNEAASQPLRKRRKVEPVESDEPLAEKRASQRDARAERAARRQRGQGADLPEAAAVGAGIAQKRSQAGSGVKRKWRQRVDAIVGTIVECLAVDVDTAPVIFAERRVGESGFTHLLYRTKSGARRYAQLSATERAALPEFFKSCRKRVLKEANVAGS
jgi:hypothetical protein